jgi:hypothetical protein
MIAVWHTEMAPAQLSLIARTLAGRLDAGLLETARTFALMGLALFDAQTSVFEAKYVHRFLRPVTAIRSGVAGGAGDPGWTPFLVTPAHPEYPSAHAVIQGAAAEVLRKAYGNHAAFDTFSPTVPGVVRHFEDVDAFVADGQAARIYGGMHFRTAVEEGRKQGRKVGKWVLETALLPID